SSRRRHTRFSRDWSSDVCSSDLGIAFGCYLVAIRVALRVAQTRRLLALVVTTAILFRVTLLFSHTIEEIDLYRYLWDGAASTQRSEERRVGKECRAGWAPVQERM